MAKITKKWSCTRELNSQDFEEIWLFHKNYVERSKEAYLKKLQSSDEILRIRRYNGELVGLVVVEYLDVTLRGKHTRIIYTPWSVLNKEFRGLNLIQKSGLRCFAKQRLAHPFSEIYWLYTASTFQSYLLMTRNMTDYWPRVGLRPGPVIEELVQHTMQQSGEERWDADTWVIRRKEHSVRYLEGIVEETPNVSHVPDIQEYATLNPGQWKGDTLLCVVPLHTQNWKALCQKAVMRSARFAKKSLLRWCKQLPTRMGEDNNV